MLSELNLILGLLLLLEITKIHAMEQIAVASKKNTALKPLATSVYRRTRPADVSRQATPLKTATLHASF